MKIANDMTVGSRHMSNNCGAFEVVEYINARNVRVQFINTGFETSVEASDIRKGRVKDRMHPSVYGIGFVGEGGFKTSVKGKFTKEYKTWQGMLERCYDPKSLDKRPTYIGCSVTHEWHNFQTFAEWMSTQDYQGKDLDKDIKVKGNKVYGPENCMFVTHADNSVEASAKHYTFYSPSGDVVEIYNLSEFCREHGLHTSTMSQVHIGKRNQHKGWTKA